MPRKKISEYRAKKIFDSQFNGFELIKDADFPAITGGDQWVVKVDQAIKKRGKQGLVKVGRSSDQAKADAEDIFAKGFSSVLVEPFIPHDFSDEKYFSLSLNRSGIALLFNKSGGVDVEENQDSMQSFNLNDVDLESVANDTKLPLKFLQNVTNIFNENFYSYLEINPLVVSGNKVTALDMAVEVDSAARFFVESWTDKDYRYPKSGDKTQSEKNVDELDANSAASFRLEVLEPNGSLFMLLSGGGASVTLADEVHNQGKGSLLANYGEYSGAPNREETEYYCDQVIDLLKRSSAQTKILIIAGGIANFTDIRTTFAGIVDSLTKHGGWLKANNAQIYVRRGGPNEKPGLAKLQKFIESSGLNGEVYGSDISLTEIIDKAVEKL